MNDITTLLAAYDTQLRALDTTGTGVWDGPLLRSTSPTGGFVGYHDLGGLVGPALDALIARQVAAFTASGPGRYEWKHHSHDLPPDLPQRLVAAGFVPEDRETVLIGPAAPLANPDPAPPGVVLRKTADPADFAVIEALNATVWGGDMSWLGGVLTTESAGEHFGVWVAEVDGQVVSAAWLRGVAGTDFAGLWGGATLEAFRGRGIYKALVAVRAAAAIADGFSLLQVDASEDSRPILQRLGFVAVTHTTPYVWRPAE